MSESTIWGLVMWVLGYIVGCVVGFLGRRNK
jgi:hypothetical protein